MSEVAGIWIKWVRSDTVPYRQYLYRRKEDGTWVETTYYISRPEPRCWVLHEGSGVPLGWAFNAWDIKKYAEDLESQAHTEWKEIER